MTAAPAGEAGGVPAPAAGGPSIAVVALAGAVVAVALGAYAHLHEPSGVATYRLFFPGTLQLKVWSTTAALALVGVQLATALRIYGRIGHGPAPSWLGPLHRTSGSVAVLLTLPVAYHCLWSIGLQGGFTLDRRSVHGVFGCVFFGAFAAKVLGLRSHRLPGWAIPVLGGLVLTSLVVVWCTSSLWFFTTTGQAGL